mmetsp:Transcript_49669/g.164534  ORF Transcript_49669/g.164534 Transcript_49669/m.164534 type:complete len:309 (-) Transcript_49669:1053-1979(-)
MHTLPPRVKKPGCTQRADIPFRRQSGQSAGAPQHHRRRKALTRPRGRASLAPPAARLEVDARAPRVAHAPPRGRAHAGALAYPVERPAALLGLAQQLVQPKRVRLVVLLHKLARARRPAARRLLARPLEAAVRPLEARRLEHSRLCLLLVRPLVLLGGRWPVDRLGGGARLEEGAVVDVVRVVAPKARSEAARLVEEPRVVQRLGRARHRLPECDSLGDVALRVARHLGPLPVLVLQPPLALALALPLLPQLVALAHVPLLLVARRVAGRQRRRRRGRRRRRSQRLLSVDRKVRCSEPAGRDAGGARS